MIKGNRKMMSTLMAGLAMSSDTFMDLGNSHTKNKRQFNPSFTKEVQPKGTTKYWFREDGTFVKEVAVESIRTSLYIFTCYSIKDSIAIKKFNKHKTNHGL